MSKFPDTGKKIRKMRKSLAYLSGQKTGLKSMAYSHGAYRVNSVDRQNGGAARRHDASFRSSVQAGFV
jgi:hypothetical protein